MKIIKALWNCCWSIVFAISYHAMTEEYRKLLTERIAQKIIEGNLWK